MTTQIVSLSICCGTVFVTTQVVSLSICCGTVFVTTAIKPRVYVKGSQRYVQ